MFRGSNLFGKLDEYKGLFFGLFIAETEGLRLKVGWMVSVIASKDLA